MQWNGGAQNSFEEVEQTRNGLNLSWGSLLYVNTKKELATARGSQFASRHYPVKKNKPDTGSLWHQVIVPSDRRIGCTFFKNGFVK